MKKIICLLLVVSGCAHVDTASGTFSQRAGMPMVLKLERHVDTIVGGPDIDEDQYLVLELRKVEIGKRLTIPSDEVAVQFSVHRFGLGSKGTSYQGWMIVKSVGKEEVVATLKLEVTAITSDGTYTETARFHGDHTFFRDKSHD